MRSAQRPAATRSFAALISRLASLSTMCTSPPSDRTHAAASRSRSPVAATAGPAWSFGFRAAASSCAVTVMVVVPPRVSSKFLRQQMDAVLFKDLDFAVLRRQPELAAAGLVMNQHVVLLDRDLDRRVVDLDHDLALAGGEADDGAAEEISQRAEYEQGRNAGREEAGEGATLPRRRARLRARQRFGLRRAGERNGQATLDLGQAVARDSRRGRAPRWVLGQQLQDEVGQLRRQGGVVLAGPAVPSPARSARPASSRRGRAAVPSPCDTARRRG